MLRTPLTLTALAATLGVTAAQDPPVPPPCHPCVGIGACEPIDPLQSAFDHSCQSHAHHDHSNLSISGSDFAQASFSSADLQGSEFFDCDFSSAAMNGADLTGVALLACQADKVSALDAQLEGADFSGSTVRNGYFLRAHLAGAVMVADFSRADLSLADLTGAVLSMGPDMADFSNANLSNVTGLSTAVGVARYSPCTHFDGTGFDPVSAGWVLTEGAEIGKSYCGPSVPNSTGSPAVLRAIGCQNVSVATFQLRAEGLPADRFGLFLTSRTEGFENPPASQGNLCLGDPMGGFGSQVQNSGPMGEMQIQVDLDDMPPPLRGAVGAGETWKFQLWFRDVNPTHTTNFTDAVSVVFLP